MIIRRSFVYIFHQARRRRLNGYIRWGGFGERDTNVNALSDQSLVATSKGYLVMEFGIPHLRHSHR